MPRAARGRGRRDVRVGAGRGDLRPPAGRSSCSGRRRVSSADGVGEIALGAVGREAIVAAMARTRRPGRWAWLSAGLCLTALALSAALALRARAAGAPVIGKLTWLGQSAFVLETEAGTRIVMDPLPKGIGYDLPAGLKADAITISHEHADHNNVGLVVNKARVLRGLTADKKGWTKIDEK